MSEPVIITGVPPPAIRRFGRPKGAGCNLQLLAKLKPGDLSSCIWGASLKKKNSIRESAHLNGIKLKVRKLEGGVYAIWRIT